jgi:imidazolonepropionase-like amidohydrolase
MSGPSIFTSGPVIDGPASQWGDGAAIVTSAEDAESVVSEQKNAGYDFIKIYSRLSPEAYSGVLAAAHRHGLKVAGHVPVAITIDDALSTGQSSIEHLLGYLDAIESEESPVRGRQGWRYRMQAFEYIDSSKIPLAARATREANVWNCPTLVAMRKWLPPDEARRLLERDEVRFMPSELLKHWSPWRGYRLGRFGPEEFELVERARQVYRALVSALRKAGAGVLVGTDTPSPLVLPGFSVHEELQNLVDAGFTPLEALEAATRAPAEYFGQKERFGVVATGARADLLLLEANPLQDVANVKQLAGVFVRGQWISKARIDSMLAELAANSR